MLKIIKKSNRKKNQVKNTKNKKNRVKRNKIMKRIKKKKLRYRDYKSKMILRKSLLRNILIYFHNSFKASLLKMVLVK